MTFKRIKYSDLNARQQENYNFQKVAGELADYGYTCIKLSDDWEGTDFLAVHVNGVDFLKVQLKGRFKIDKKYCGKNIFIAFLDGEDCYIFPHDEVMRKILALDIINESKSWTEGNSYSWRKPTRWAKILLSEYKI